MLVAWWSDALLYSFRWNSHPNLEFIEQGQVIFASVSGVLRRSGEENVHMQDATTA